MEPNSRGHFRFEIFAEDITAYVGIIFRFTAGIIAFATITYYFAKKNISQSAVYKILRWILIFEGIYWFSLLTTGLFEIQNLLQLHNPTVSVVLNSLATGVLPSLIESLAIPVALFILVYKLNPNKPLKPAIQWGLISGTLYVFVFWLINSNLWISVINEKGMSYLTSHPQNLLSFILTAFGLLALTLYTVGFTIKSRKAETLQDLNLKIVGGIILALGMYFLWNYLTWIFFGGNYLWSDWYAWFLGHNEDLWIMALPLLGIPMLFLNKPHEEK